MNYWYIYGLDMGYAQVKSNHKFLKMYIVIILCKMKGDVLHFYSTITFCLSFVFIFTFILHYTV